VVLSPLLEVLQRDAPRMTIEILALEDNFVERLAGDEYDLAIRDRWALRSARHMRTLFDEDYVCIARRDHPRASAVSVAWRSHCLTSWQGPPLLSGPILS
jgi:DNA-binding transcriptional LysR family regulator